MEFSILSDSFNKMESTRKRLELTQFLVELFEKTPHEVISKIVYLLQGKLRPDFEGVELGVAEKLAIRSISKSSGIPIKKIGEASYILKILLGSLRLGIAENTMMDALAIAFSGNKDNRKTLEYAYNVSSDLGKVAETIATKGLEGIEKFEIILFNPIRPMLADRVKSEEEAIEKMGNEFAAEYKLDGERVQIHIEGEKVVLFSRSLENISSYYPDIIEKISKSIQADNVILEAEIVAINENTGEFLPFQELMHRRRKYKIEKAVTQYPITVNCFDILYCNGKSCLELEYKDRRDKLEKIVKEGEFAKHIPMKVVENENEINDFLENSINAGSEGLMLKMLDKPYQAGTRGSYWLKLKREYQNELGDSLDLVVIGGFFGKGRRTGNYGTLLLATYDEDEDIFTSICKVGTGFSDEDLDQLYQMLSPKVTIKMLPPMKKLFHYTKGRKKVAHDKKSDIIVLKKY
ncbi:DNA ligase protein [Marine Group I thaumarchaeote SCGC RSA3]|uniref:DNA ligase n=1 Tax=Marine Group I thaumarchaeote SCGC RSA3 TaxID=1503183 RepID=A0A087RVK4_9ARCH|nr:DNA ligase protein [Marine Group I thaumarchaeote SCGC RSA3]